MECMRKIAALMTAMLLLPASLWAAGYSVSGRVLDARAGAPLGGVVVTLDENFLWAVTGEKGEFVLQNVPKGSYALKVSCLGYVDDIRRIEVGSDISGLVIRLKENSLALKEVVVTAQKASDAVGTSHTLGRDALNHLQMSSMSDMAALLPGGKTVNPDLTSSSAMSLRAGSSSAGNAAFGTALEVDGVRIGNNAAFSEMTGVDTRSVSVDNVESVEVITGVPSAEYGDLNSGVVKIHTRKGRTPLNISFTVNPRTYQTSVSKGVALPHDRGVVNVSGEWARATRKLVSPYESYTRRGMSLSYSNTFFKTLRFEIGATGNIGGMNSEDDPDAFSGEYMKVRANTFRANTALTWQLNKPWITSLKADASVNFGDNLSHTHAFNSYGSNQPAVHSELEGYYLADRLPLTFFSDLIIDSKELDYAASFKYELLKKWGEMKSSFKAGSQWKANGNAGQGECYEDASLAANGYRPRPYSDYPFMHNLSFYAEEDFTAPLGSTRLQIVAGLRMENVFIQGTRYENMNTWSPRLNVKWSLTENLALRAGWGVTEKLPSFHILYPKQEYRDIQTFGFSHGESSSYVYYTQPYSLEYNPSLRWQRNRNAELGIDARIFGAKLSIAAFYNITGFPYELVSEFTPFSYRILQLPSGFSVPSDPHIKADNQTGEVFIRGGEEEFWTAMDTKVTDRTFASSTLQSNGTDVKRAGVEFTLDFPQIEAVFTQFRLDGSYSRTSTHDESLGYFYQKGWSHTSLPNRSFQYVGIYANGGSAIPVMNGKLTSDLDANLTMITHIPQARLIVTCRLEASLITRSRNISRYKGRDYAFTVGESSKTPTGGNISDGDSYTAVYPVAYMDLDGAVHEFTAAEAENPEFQNLILKSTNARIFAQDGYGPYMSANLSITKEIGDHVSVSFFANNFTNSRPYVKSFATGVGAIFTPAFYYGLTCRLRF